jgi:hypothetical protein
VHVSKSLSLNGIALVFGHGTAKKCLQGEWVRVRVINSFKVRVGVIVRVICSYNS